MNRIPIRDCVASLENYKSLSPKRGVPDWTGRLSTEERLLGAIVYNASGGNFNIDMIVELCGECEQLKQDLKEDYEGTLDMLDKLPIQIIFQRYGVKWKDK